MTVEDTFCPPTVPIPPPVHTYSDYSDLPNQLDEHTLDKNGKLEPLKIILGIDEAGRGPIIGPMVYSVAYCSLEFAKNVLPSHEFADSKKLTEPKRWELMKRVCEETGNGELGSYLGYAITSLTALDIASNMLRPSNMVVNLNEQAHMATINLIKGVINKIRNEIDKDREIIISGVYIDTVGPPASYTKKLREYFPINEIQEIRVEKKADATYPIVSAASVIAKVTRDWSIKCSAEENAELPEDIKDWGSGYPSDPRTSKWINSKINPWFGWDSNIRYSWGTAKNALENNKSTIEMRWEHELVKKHGFDDVVGMFGNGKNGTTNTKFEVSKDWFVM